MKAYLLTAGLIWAWLVTPESLMLIGSISGQYGILVIMPLLAGMLLAVFSAVLIHNTGLVRHGLGGDVVLKKAFGQVVGATIVMIGRIPILLFGSVGILVSAGFAFNEIFIYWFPNFLFASLLLMTICALNIFKERAALLGQFIFVGTAVIGLLILLIIGVGQIEQVTAQTVVLQHGFSPSIFGLCFLLFLGFDFYRPLERGVVPLVVIIVLAFLLLGGWAMLAISQVEPSKLADSTISYLLIARAVNGDAGRMIMGLVIISGALSGVNGLYIVVRRTFAELAEEKTFPAIMVNGWPITILVTIIIEILMITGFAGEEILESQIRASLLLWLLYLGCRSFAAGLQLSRIGAGGWLHGSIVSGVIMLFIGSLIAVDEKVMYLLNFQVVSIIGFLLLLFAWVKISGRILPN